MVATDLPDQAPAAAEPPRGAAIALSRRGARLAEIPATARAASAGLLLAGGVPAPDLFPAAAWARCSARVLKSAAGELALYPPPQGLRVLREQIAEHLAATRGLVADPGCIVVTAGTQQALRTAAELLLDPGDPVWVEDLGYIAGRGALLAAGAELTPVPSDAEGMDVAAGERMAPGARMALVALSHATPLGGALPVARRLALLDWARRADARVLEDDCDSEFRWEGKPPPLAPLEKAGQVIYCGTFSKTLAPALRVGFAIVPAPLVAAFVRLRTLTDRGTDAFSQAILAEFIREGLLAPHIRRMRTEYARRREALLEAMGRFVNRATPLAAPGGLHMVVRLAEASDEGAVVRACAARDLSVAPLRAYYAGAPHMSGLVVGFAVTPVGIAGEMAKRLEAALAAADRPGAGGQYDR
jgi:GntR family transcriptional regulator/MocR family aminotransferase